MDNKKNDSGKSEKPKPTKEQVQERILEKIKSLYETEKGKKYIAHLVSAFWKDAKIVTDKREGIKLRCAITSFPILIEREVFGNNEDIRLAYSSHKSSKLLSGLTLICLKEFINQELLKSNKHIELCIKPRSEKIEDKQQNTINVNQPKNIEVNTVKSQQPYILNPPQYQNNNRKVINNTENNNKEPEFKRATFSLADNDVLSNLKKQLSDANQ